jgi:predicted NBD/HSP70 family sugar kinase
MSNISGKPQAMKKVNNLLVKKALRKRGSATKSELAEDTGISATTIRTLLDELIEANEVIRFGLDKSSGGRRAERYALNLNESLVLAFYVRNKYIDYAIANAASEIIENKQVEVNSENYADDIDKAIHTILKNNNCIKVIGISVPGIVDIDNRKYLAGKKLGGWEEFDIGEYIENKYNIPVLLENDLNAIALGHSLNLMKKLDVDDLSILNMIYIYFAATGVGAGIVTNGELVRGGNNFAGELGFMPVTKDKYLQGFIETNPEDESYVDIISRVIATVNCVINPDIVVIGGETFRFELMEEIEHKCSSYIAINAMPDIFYVEDSKVDCFTGIVHLAIKKMYSGINLIDNSKKS